MTLKTLGSGALALVALGLVSTAALALDRHVIVNNNTSYVIREFYASNKGTNNWEEDILGDDVLNPGQSMNVNVDDASGYCKFDFLAVFEDGDQVTKADVNVCEVSEFNFND